MLGALRDTFVLYDYGLEIARQCRLIGAHINFAPVVDINTNPANPVINTRSFGSDPHRVAAYAAAYAKGLERGGVMAVMKHFPGHGDTSEDSHLELAGLHRSRAGLDSFELVPFKHLIRQGVSGVMTGHLSVPALETDVRLPASQSAAVIKGLLKKELGFDGLCITDALGMKGASTQSGDICVRALQAGNDILLAPPNPAADVKAILSAIEQGSLSQQEIDEKCRKVLIYKYILGLNTYKPADTSSLQKRLNTAEVQRLSRYMYANSITLLRNRQDLLPFRHLSESPWPWSLESRRKLFVKMSELQFSGGFFADARQRTGQKGPETNLWPIRQNHRLRLLGQYQSDRMAQPFQRIEQSLRLLFYIALPYAGVRPGFE